MSNLNQLLWTLFFVGSLSAADLRSNTGDTDIPKQPDQIFSKVVQRAQALADGTNSPIYLFDKRTTIDTFDSKGKLTKRKVKLFLVTMTGGVPEEKLIALEGESLSAKEIEKEQEKSSVWRRKFAKPNDNSTRSSFVPADLAKKFDLNYLRSEKIRARNNHVIGFKPKTDGPKAKSFSDRIINQLTGRIWIDAQDSEITRVEVKLGQKVSLWAGLLGALYSFEFKLDRRRSPADIWYNHLSDIRLDARGLFKRLRMNIREQSSNLRPAE